MSMERAKKHAGESVHERPCTSGRLAGKLAVVTGAAQGFGYGIARELLKEGASVILADLNLAQAQTAAMELAAQTAASELAAQTAASELTAQTAAPGLTAQTAASELAAQTAASELATQTAASELAAQTAAPGLTAQTAAPELAAQTATQQSGARAAALHVDVADPESVKALVIKTVEILGGIDLFVSNAGVLKAGGMDDMTPEDFEFVTKVNYTGFFLCAKYAGEIMKAQYKADNTRWSDIVQINSKSGLTGSKANFAYSGGKFGGIGLAQSFALELAPYQIKVNAVCPGNYYDGPLWSDPENGLFIQYLKAGKVPGARTVEDVRRFYLSKSPIQRGCTPEDAAKAVLYCVEQKFETGQAIPVTGGQVMLS